MDFTCSLVGNFLLFKGFFQDSIDRVGSGFYYLSISGKKWEEVVYSGPAVMRVE